LLNQHLLYCAFTLTRRRGSHCRSDHIEITLGIGEGKCTSQATGLMGRIVACGTNPCDMAPDETATEHGRTWAYPLIEVQNT
jgi:hypothetical protein